MNTAKTSYFELKGKKKEMFQKLTNIQTKNKLLRNLVGFVQNTANVEKRWENFELAIGDFDNILSEQTKTIKQEIGTKHNKNKLIILNNYHFIIQEREAKLLTQRLKNSMLNGRT